MGGSVVTLCSVHVVCCLPGTWLGCVIMRAWGEKQTTFHRYVRTRHKIMHFVLKPGKSSCPHPPKKTLWGLPRAPEGKDRARTSTDVSGRAPRVDYLAFCPKVLVQRDTFEKVRTFHKHNCIRYQAHINRSTAEHI